MKENLERFDSELKDEMYCRKDFYIDDIADNIDQEEHKNKYIIQKTKKLYFDCITNIRGINMINVNDIQPYYFRGRIHNSVNERLFSWIISEEDLI